ncbi:type II secretion system F family protein [Lottiidibacillus patelloidae]|nr:type II secretion system F family protein [Lottiidibacillus patelloidae]
MEWAFIICVFLTVLILTIFFGTFIVQKINYKLRIRYIMKENIITKKNKKKKVPRKDNTIGKFMQKLEMNIDAAAIPLSPKEFIVILLVINVLIIIFTTFLLSIVKSFIICIMLDGLIFFILPKFHQRRKNKMVAQLPDVLDLISNALKTGYSIVQTLDLVSKENFSPLSEEFGKLVQALKFGESFEVAFNDLAKRLDIREIQTVVDTILITRETGGNMTHVIEGLLEIMRENQRLQGEVKALTAQGRISSLVIGSMPIFLFAVLMMISPDYMMLLFSHPLGIIMVIIAVVSQIIGYVIMHKLIQLKVR